MVKMSIPVLCIRKSLMIISKHQRKACKERKNSQSTFLLYDLLIGSFQHNHFDNQLWFHHDHFRFQYIPDLAAFIALVFSLCLLNFTHSCFALGSLNFTCSHFALGSFALLCSCSYSWTWLFLHPPLFALSSLYFIFPCLKLPVIICNRMNIFETKKKKLKKISINRLQWKIMSIWVYYHRSNQAQSHQIYANQWYIWYIQHFDLDQFYATQMK